MHADLDLLLISVYCTADDLLPPRAAKRAPEAERRGDRDALCRAGADGDPERPPVSAGGAAAARASVPGAAQPGRAAQAARAARGHDRVADRRVRRAEPGQPRRSAAARLDPGRVRPLRSRRPAAPQLADVCGYGYSEATPAGFGGCGCTWSAPPTAHHARPHSSPPTVPSARSRSSCLPARTARRRNDRRATRATPAASSRAPSANSTPRSCGHRRKERARHGAAPRADPPTDRIGLLDLQRPAHPRTPRRPHPPRPPPASPPPPRTRRLHQPQPPTRPTQAAHSPTTSPNPWHQPSSPLRRRSRRRTGRA